MSKIAKAFENFVPDAQGVMRRFPLATLMIACFAILVLLKANNNDVFNDEMMMRLVGGTVLAAYLSIILTLVGEGRGNTVAVIVKACVVVIALLAAYFFRELAFITPMAIGAAVLWLGSAPFWQHKRDDVAVWDFTHKIWSGVIFTVAGSIIYMIGIFAISTALKSLFSINIRDFIEDWMFPVGFAFLAPMAWMSMIPRHDEDDSDSLRNPGFISHSVGFLGTWILAPLTLVYALILFAYMVKIVLSQSVPNGEIAQLVTPFLIIGTLTWLILDPPFIQEKRLARWFHKFWFPLMIPAALLLAFAVYLRIREYGWTIERYLLVLASIWALGLAVWFSIKGTDKRDIRIIPGFAALLLVVGSIGPWGADGLSAMNQNSRLNQSLKANNMLNADGHMKATGLYELTDKDAAIAARSSLDYLLKAKKHKRIDRFFDTPLDFGEGKWAAHKPIRKKFGLSDVTVPNMYNRNVEPQHHYEADDTIMVQGYDYITAQQSHNMNNTRTKNKNTTTMGRYKIIANGHDFIVLRDNIELRKTDVLKWLKAQNFNSNDENTRIPNLILYSENDVEIALHLSRTTYDIGNDKAFAYIEYMLLAKGVEIKQ